MAERVLGVLNLSYTDLYDDHVLCLPSTFPGVFNF